jgi:predicted ATPase
MLTGIGLENFKSWRRIERAALAPITGLFGTNSSGKSSILQPILLLKQTATSSDRRQPLNLGGKDDFVRLGSYADLIHNHDVLAKLRLSLDWDLPRPLKLMRPDLPNSVLFSGSRLSFDTHVALRDRERLVTEEIRYKLDGEAFSLAEKPESPGEYELRADTTNNSFRFTRTTGRVWPLPGPTRCYGFPDQTNAYFQNAGFLSDLELELETQLGRIFYLGPLREYPQRDYRWSGGEPQDVGQRGELSVDAMLAGVERGATISPGYKKRRQSIDQRVAFWLRELGLIHEFKVQRIGKSNVYEVRVKRSQSSSEVLLPDVGFGISQVLPVLVLCYYAPEGSTLIFEQPEIHLHPSVQAGLADVFIDVMMNRNVQVILESHSEHLLLRLQRRIAEQRLEREKVALFFSNTVADGSQLTPLDLDIFGSVANWPPDFFGDRFEEVAAREEAALTRQTSQTDGD